jgi:4-hydroxy-tetrahydrodipicolinate reductase
MTKIIIHGCNGKMGQVLAAIAKNDPGIQVVAGVDKYPDMVSHDFPVYSDFSQIGEGVDAVIDFSVPAALPSILAYGERTKTPVIIATTGLSPRIWS